MLYLVGVGGAGSKIVDSFFQKNVVRKIIDRFQTRVQWESAGVVVDTSDKVKALSNIPAENIALIGKSKVKGHGTGVDVSLGKKIMSEELSIAMNALSKVVTEKPWAALVFAGLGGGTGTGGVPVFAKKIKETYKCKTLGIFILPSTGEGRVYSKNAFEGLNNVLSSVDGAIILDNNVLTDRGEDIFTAHRELNKHVLSFFRMIDEAFIERCFEEVSTIAYSKVDSHHASIKELIEKMLREDMFLKFELEKSSKMVFVARGNLDYLYGHDFAQGWVESKFKVQLEFEFYDDPSAKSVEAGLLVIGTKDLNGRFDDLTTVDNKGQTSELDDLLNDIHAIF